MSNLTPIVDTLKFSFKEKFTRTWYFESWRDKIILMLFFFIGIFSTLYFITKLLF